MTCADLHGSGADGASRPPAPGDHRRGRLQEHTPSSSKKNPEMSIARQYVDILSRPYITIRTPPARPVALDEPPVLPAEPLPPPLPAVTHEAREPLSVTGKKRGRPATGNALTAAEKQRRYRERLAARKASG